MKAYKGFDKDLKCRGYQFAIGETFEEPSAEVCVRGFHAVTNPLDALAYYAQTHTGDSKKRIEREDGYYEGGHILGVKSVRVDGRVS